MKNTNLQLVDPGDKSILLKRDRNKKKLENKLLDYDLFLDKKQLKANKKIKKLEKDNEFKYREVDVKCNMKNLSLKAGYMLGKMCLVLTFISCLLTFGGNMDKFICNIPLLDGENKSDYLITWTNVLSTTIEHGKHLRNIEITRLNLLTTLIYIPLLIGLQAILYQVSLTIHIIKTKFKQYYIYALILQYTMLFYSVASNYLFISYYVKPTGILDRLLCFIPSLLLDVASIFFLSLSMRMKTLNFDDGKVEQIIKNKSNKLINILDKFKSKKKQPNKYKLKDNVKLEKNIESKIVPNVNAVSTDNSGNGNKKPEIKTLQKKNSFVGKKPTGRAIGKTKDKDLKRTLNYIEKLKENNTKILKVKDLQNRLKIDKNKWCEIRKSLLKENIIHVNESTPRTIFITYKEATK